MSKAGNLRDALAAELTARLTVQVDAVVIPHYTRETLVAAPRVCVMSNGRELTADMGPDDTKLVVGVGVAGSRPKSEGYGLTDAARLKHERDAADQFDAIMESIVRLFVPNGILADTDLAGHIFEAIDQPIFLDAEAYREKGVWLSVVLITYRDIEDE